MIRISAIPTVLMLAMITISIAGETPTRHSENKYPEYGFTRHLDSVSYEDAMIKVTDALKTEGFGIITDINVTSTMKKKLDVDYKKYTILGACNPKFAHKALEIDPFIGLLLPCNVVVMEDENGTGSIVSVVSPKAMFKVIDNPEMSQIAEQVEQRLKNALQSL